MSVATKVTYILLNIISRIREKRKIVMLESREKRKVEKPRLPRTAKKMLASKMEKTMEDLGVEFEDKNDVRTIQNYGFIGQNLGLFLVFVVLQSFNM